jgi:tetratricopeptide (TPR) repeat protein
MDMGIINRLVYFLIALLLTGCFPKKVEMEPKIFYVPQERMINALPSAFPPLTPLELTQDWGKELKIANTFARELDLYRAITSYKRALVFIPLTETKRRQQIYFGIFESYYLGQKYTDALNIFETTELTQVTQEFPSFGELLIMLYECYQKTDQFEKAEKILEIIEKGSAQIGCDLRLSTALIDVDLPVISNLAPNFFCDYLAETKSVRKAQLLNALLPGAGYYYVGEKRSALTSFMINALFIAAAYSFFDHGNIAAGIITLSLESGWYFGGINGAGLAANEFNERVYETKAKDFMFCKKLFPVLMFNTSF